MPRRPRLDKTFSDYVAIAIGPVLIMCLIGSLVFFLLAVCYQGQFEVRLNFILSCFIVATVLIGRISMDEGTEHATMYAIPLALVSGLAMMKFVVIEGPLAAFGLAINLGLLALIWWCAHKLTWDCTLIDEAENATGEGLLQNIGMDDEPTSAQLPASTARETPTSTAEDRHLQELAAQSWWSRLGEKRRQPHPPGLWVVYFSLAALPLFGVGQWFIPADATATRTYTFVLLACYVGSALGLLLSTSFLGLRRYLRQRDIEMPGPMAAGWIGTGGLMILVLLLVCAILPRPGSNFAFAERPFRLGSPDDLSPNDWGMGNDGMDESGGNSSNQNNSSEEGSGGSDEDKQSGSNQSPDGRRKTPGDGNQDSDKAGGAQNQTGSSSDGDASKSNEANSSNDQGKSEQNQGSQNKGGGKKGGGKKGDQASQTDSNQQGDGNQSSQKQSGNSNNDGQSGSEQNQGDNSKGGQDGNKQGDNSQSGDNQGDTNKGDNQGDATGKDRSDKSGDKNDQSKSSGGDQTNGGDDNAEKSDGESGDRNSDPAAPSFGDERGSKKPRSEADKPRRRSGKQRPKRSRQPRKSPKLSGSFLATIVNVLKWVVTIVVAVVLAFLIWKNWAKIVAAWKKLLDDIRSWFRGESTPEAADAETQPEATPLAPFASFRDPFSSGMADQAAPAEVIRYTFAAVEAWAREHGVPRQEQQTAYEFARDVGELHSALARGTKTLAQLYSQAAYAAESLPRSAAKHLRGLWQDLYRV